MKIKIQFILVIIFSVFSLPCWADVCTLVDGDCPEVSPPSSEVQLHQPKEFYKQISAQASADTGFNTERDIYPQLISQMITGDIAHDSETFALITAPAARFCLWTAHRAQSLQYYDFIPENDLIIKRDQAVLRHQSGICDCYHLKEETIQQSKQYTDLLLRFINGLASPAVKASVKQGADDYHNIQEMMQYVVQHNSDLYEILNQIKQADLAQNCQNYLNEYMQQLQQCPRINCLPYEKVYGALLTH